MSFDQTQLTKLRHLLASLFNDSELRTLCFDLGVDYENLPDPSKDGKVRELVLYLQRKGRLADLLQLAKQLRPQVEWFNPDSNRATAITVSPNQSVLHNLPRRKPFLGREEEKDKIHQALSSDADLISVEGIGGIGKSSLALQVAYECLQNHFPSGKNENNGMFWGYVWASAKDNELTLNSLLDVILHTLDYIGVAQKPLDEKTLFVQRLLREQACLLIVDNFETITDEGLHLFLNNLPEPSKALITTREKNPQQAKVISLKGLTKNEGLALIRQEGERLGLTALQKAKDELLSNIYYATGGTPLAIKWAVGQIKQKGQTLETVLDSLSKARGSLFDTMFSRSWELLKPEAQQILMSMPFFATSASWDSINETNRVMHLDESLGQLVEMSLVDASDELEQMHRRYAIHPLTRFFATNQLQRESQSEARIWQGLINYYRYFVDKNGGIWNYEGYERLDLELPNVLNVVRLAIEKDNLELANFLSYSVSDYMVIRGFWNDVMVLSLELLRINENQGNDLATARLRAWPLGWLYRHLGKLELAKEETQKGLAVIEQSDDEAFTAYTHRNLGRVYEELGDFDQAEELITKSLRYYDQLEDHRHRNFLTANLASVALKRGEFDKAWELCDSVLLDARSRDDPERLADILNIMGSVALKKGEGELTKELWQEALEHMKRARRFDGIAGFLLNLGQLELKMGNRVIASNLLQEALVAFQKLGMENTASEIEQLLTI